MALICGKPFTLAATALLLLAAGEPAAAVPADLSGNGRSALVWRATDGGLSIWTVDGLKVKGTSYGFVPPDWSVAGTGDFNGDGKSDLFWRRANGATQVWLMNGRDTIGFVDTGTLAADYLPVAVADFNGDGKADIVYRRSNGQNYMQLTGGSAGIFGPTLDTDWVLQGAGDTNGDGRADLVWRNNRSGDVSVWTMNGATVTGSATLPTPMTNEWQVKGLADFDGDGKVDILWRQYTGDNYLWALNGASVKSYVQMPDAGPEWAIHGVGDFDGDGKPDILYRNSVTEEAFAWLMDGVVIASAGSLGNPGTAWNVEQPCGTSQHLVLAGANCPASPGARPRLWLSDAKNYSRLVGAARANSAEWTRLKNFCDTRTLTTFDYQGLEAYRYIGNFGLCYRIVRTLSGATAAAPYAQKAINVLQDPANPVLNFTQYSTDSGFGIRAYLPALALAYDWLFDSPLLTTQIRAAIISRMNNWLTWYAASGYSNAAPISNYNAGYMIGGIMAAVAIAGDDATSASVWSGAIGRYVAAQQMFDLEMPGGHWPEGWNYGPKAYQSHLIAAAALRSMSGDAGYLFPGRWMSNNVVNKMNSLTPNGKFYYDDGLWSGDTIGDPRWQDMAAAGFAYGWDSMEGRMAKSYIDKAIASGVSPVIDEQWMGFLFYDPTAVPVDLTAQPRSHHAEGTGLVTMRSDWTSANATWATFITGKYLSYQGEQDKDQGHMTLYKGAPLLIDVGHALYTDAGQRNTVFHNTFTMEGRTDPTPYTTFTSSQLAYSGECPNPLGTNPIGINAFADRGTHLFASGEFSAAYQNPPVDAPYDCGRVPVSWLNRSVLFVRPGVFVVYDQIQKVPTQPNLAPTMHWHFPTQPTPQGGSNRQLSLDNGGARLQFITVFPSLSNSVLAYNAKNTSVGPGISNWHLSVAYSSQAPQYQNFLTVMRAGFANTSYPFPGVVAISGTNAYGSYISDLNASENPLPLAVVFADNGLLTVPASVQYQYFSASATQNYVARLKPNRAYSVGYSVAGSTYTVTIAESGSGITSDEAGVLAFTVP